MFFGVFDLPRWGDVVVALLLTHVTIVAGRWRRASNSSRSCRTGAKARRGERDQTTGRILAAAALLCLNLTLKPRQRAIA